MSSVYRLLLGDPIHEQARNLLASRPGFEVAVACRLTGSKHRDLSAIGAFNGWTLLMGQVPMAAARDDLFPPIFQRLSSRGVPALGIIISAILATLLVSSQVAGPPGFAAFYELVVGLSTMAAVIRMFSARLPQVSWRPMWREADGCLRGRVAAPAVEQANSLCPAGSHAQEKSGPDHSSLGLCRKIGC